MPKTLYMVVEHFKNKDAVPVYRRFRDHGRMTPEGLAYISSWVDRNFERCYQLMETDDSALLEEWMAKWSDLTDFEVYPVVTSKEAAEKNRAAAVGSRIVASSAGLRDRPTLPAVVAAGRSVRRVTRARPDETGNTRPGSAAG